MATKLVQDYRRTDQRRYIYQPYWITSAEAKLLDFANDETECGLMFSFPATKYGTSKLLVHEVFAQVTEACTGGTITTVFGTYTLATDDVTTGGVMTIVTADAFIASGSITHGTAGLYTSGAGAFVTAKAAGLNATPMIVTPADATVPAFGFYPTTDASYTAGKIRFHLLVSEIPMV